MASVAARAGSGSWLRLRQICLVAADLERQAELVRGVFGLEACYRDPNVARYGLANVLFAVGTDFIEIVAPTRPGTAAGRFLERHKGRNGYMIIMDCEDPAARQAHCESIGVRTANLIRHDSYLGVQLHPKDTGGAMIEFNRTEGGSDPRGPYAPAGPGWQACVRQDVTQRLLSAQIECADPAAFSARWAEILERPVQRSCDGHVFIALDAGRIHFVRADSDPVLAGIELQVSDRMQVLERARALGCIDSAGAVQVCGIRVGLREATES